MLCVLSETRQAGSIWRGHAERMQFRRCNRPVVLVVDLFRLNPNKVLLFHLWSGWCRLLFLKTQFNLPWFLLCSSIEHCSAHQLKSVTTKFRPTCFYGYNTSFWTRVRVFFWNSHYYVFWYELIADYNSKKYRYLNVFVEVCLWIQMLWAAFNLIAEIMVNCTEFDFIPEGIKFLRKHFDKVWPKTTLITGEKLSSRIQFTFKLCPKKLFYPN